MELYKLDYIYHTTKLNITTATKFKLTLVLQCSGTCVLLHIKRLKDVSINILIIYSFK